MPFVQREALHDQLDKERLHINLPRDFFACASEMLMKHFIQWIKPDLLMLTLAGDPFVSKAFSRWLLDLPMENISLCSKFHDATFFIPQLITFLTSEVESNKVLHEKEFFRMFKSSIELIAEQNCVLFPENPSDLNWSDSLQDLREHVCESWLPLSSNTQWIEALVKDAAFCAETGKSETAMSNLSMLRSLMIPSVNDSVKALPEFINSSRHKKEGRDFACGKKHTKLTLDFVDTMIETTSVIPQEEIDFCDAKLKDATTFKLERHNTTLQRLKDAKDVEKGPNKAMLRTGITYMPLLKGDVQFGKLGKKHCSFMVEEIERREQVTLDKKEKKLGIRALSKRLKELIYPPREEELTEKEIETQMFFTPLCRPATEWFSE